MAPTTALWHCNIYEYKNDTLSGEKVTWSNLFTTFSSTVPVINTAEAITITATISTLSSDITIGVINIYGTQLSLFFGSNVGAPFAVGNPKPTILADAVLTQYFFPTGWAEKINVGPNLNYNGSKIKGSYTDLPDIDVSYVDSYFIPITCFSKGIAVTGCNINLFKQQDITYNTQVNGPVYFNSARDFPMGPASPFFAACTGAAYIYPKDDDVNKSNLGSNLVFCCIGTSCEAPSRQLPKQP